MCCHFDAAFVDLCDDLHLYIKRLKASIYNIVSLSLSAVPRRSFRRLGVESVIQYSVPTATVTRRLRTGKSCSVVRLWSSPDPLLMEPPFQLIRLSPPAPLSCLKMKTKSPALLPVSRRWRGTVISELFWPGGVSAPRSRSARSSSPLATDQHVVTFHTVCQGSDMKTQEPQGTSDPPRGGTRRAGAPTRRRWPHMSLPEWRPLRFSWNKSST